MKAYVWSDAMPPPPMRRAAWRRFVERHLPNVVIYLMVATLVAVVLYPHVVVTVPSGQSTNSKIVVIGSGKDGLPVIFGNAELPAPPPAGSTPSGNDAPRERTTAASPMAPLEKTPAAGLAWPTEKIPPASDCATPTYRTFATWLREMTPNDCSRLSFLDNSETTGRISPR